MSSALAAEGPRRSILRWTWWPLIPLTFVAATGAAPYFLTHGFLAMGLALYRGFAIACHQRPDRSFWIFGASVAVCSRCLGIYAGAAMGLLFRTSRWIAMRFLLAAVALNLLDAMTELAGLHGNWLAIRFALGLLLGIAAALMISSADEAPSARTVPSLKGLVNFSHSTQGFRPGLSSFAPAGLASCASRSTEPTPNEFSHTR